VDRAGLYRAQTPQAFTFEPFLRHIWRIRAGLPDDVEVARAAGLDVAIVEGEESNLKLTFPGDFARAEAILKGAAWMCGWATAMTCTPFARAIMSGCAG
jgi:2-C-methyl-D-erythritol 4-phosphate cytidylyltransferase/2-C-methyl-D-erythritol 2,4-cyclodiphosphate synthase